MERHSIRYSDGHTYLNVQKYFIQQLLKTKKLSKCILLEYNQIAGKESAMFFRISHYSSPGNELVLAHSRADSRAKFCQTKSILRKPVARLVGLTFHLSSKIIPYFFPLIEKSQAFTLDIDHTIGTLRFILLSKIQWMIQYGWQCRNEVLGEIFQ